MSRLFAPEAWSLSSDDWYTPKYIFDALGIRFDLDPCSAAGGVPWVPADRYYTIDHDGLTQPWDGSVWLNPPYSQPWPWIEKLTQHGNGIALIPADTANRGFQKWAVPATAHCFLRDRVNFVRLGNNNKTTARFPSVLCAWGDECSEAVRSCGLGWVVVSA